ncbi:MAG TPA: PilZ domain-containing protein [Sphingomonas sp.]|uniref:PilZ domain-containing protein n=1 Tax=Sphingomonas sp. TaxID=28214 RepID=UPI002BE0EAE7|nr:PilZ domain-containing protein [Sphingomonas sp.]HMI19134.1 PilZ domain-containing protein [Sphingomonas sp.]
MPFSAKLYDDPTPDLPVSRSRTHLAASLSSHLHHVIIHNLSPEGLLIESRDELEIGAEVTVDISDLGPHAAHVIWRDGVFYDCQFVTPIPAAQVRQKLTSAKVVWAPFASLSDADSLTRPYYVPFPPQTDPSGRTGLSRRARLTIILAAASLCWMIPAALIFALAR